MRSKSRLFFLFFPCLCFFSFPLFAEIVEDVGMDGTLTLGSGKQVVLAGLQMDAEGVSVLRVLVQKQDVRLQLLSNSASGGKESAYVYLQAKYLKFPVALGDIPKEKEVLINEFLVRTGAAKVAEKQELSHKTQLLKAQEVARKKGEGVWSYEVP